MKLDKELCEHAGGQWSDGRCQGALCFTCYGWGDWRGLSRSHIVPKSRGGKDSLINIVLECYLDHEKYEKHPERRPLCQQSQVKEAMEEAGLIYA
ncbi:hypothetical protein MUP77_00575, partial [Candidatus Bathyarchaeota archaeon]|nr:hypothetical protein [Candidatus Bathyarchaeota archaeon]